MTIDQKINIANVIGTWFAGMATLGAVLASLYYAGRGERIKLLINAGLRSVFKGDGTPPEEVFMVSVTNVADRNVVIENVTWTIGKGKNQRFAIQPFNHPRSQQCPVELSHGKSATFMVLFQVGFDWASDFANGFVQNESSQYLKSLFLRVHISTGKFLRKRPEPELIELLRSKLHKSK